MIGKDSRVVRFTATKELKKELEALAKEKGVSLSKLCAYAMAQYVVNMKK